jgi:hypothetical protein
MMHHGPYSTAHLLDQSITGGVAVLTSVKQCLPMCTPNLRMHRKGRRRRLLSTEDIRSGCVCDASLGHVGWWIGSENGATTVVPTAGTGQLNGAVGSDRPEDAAHV